MQGFENEISLIASAGEGSRHSVRGAGRGVLLAGLILGASVAPGVAQVGAAAGDARGQNAGPADAQVEANVLRALAGAPALANEAITTRTVYGVVTLSGSVGSEALRSQAETLASNADGVKKVIDELQLGAGRSQAAGDPSSDSSSSARSAQNGSPVSGQEAVPGGGPRPLVLQSDGSYAPAAPDDGTPAGQQNGSASLPDGAPAQPTGDPRGGGPAGRPSNQPYEPPYRTSNGGPYGTPSGHPGSYPQAYPGANGPGQGGYGQGGYGQGGYGGAPQAGRGAPVWGGQTGGEAVVVPSGTMIRVRLNRTLSSEETPAGTTFDAQVVNDVVAGGEIAIPRGATAAGRVIEAKRAGTLSGRGELSVELTSVTLGGKIYPLVSDAWEHHGGDKSLETVNKAAGLGVLGAVVGAVAGGGTGAAIGGGVGAAAGVGASAASGRGQVFIPAEGVVTFHLRQEASVTTVSEAEMARLSQGTAPGVDGRFNRPRPNQRVYLPPNYPQGYPGPYGYPPYGPYGYPR